MYRLVHDLLLENPAGAELKEDVSSGALLSSYRVERHTDINVHKAWLIHLDDIRPKNLLFSKECFEFRGRHLRIDACFANDNTLKAKRGLSRCHYTEKYVHTVIGERKTVHVYIGESGYISSQIKKYKAAEDKREDLPVNSVL